MTRTEIRPDVRINTFGKGMTQDVLPEYMANDSYTYALNAVHNSHEYRGGFLVNEKSNELVASFGAAIVGITYIDERNQSLVFTRDNAISLYDHIDKRVIPLVDGDAYPPLDKCDTQLATTGCWDFSKCEMMYATFKSFGACRELHAYFTSGCHVYVINIDELQDAGRKAGLTCEDFRLMKCTNNPHISAEVSETGGHGLSAGAYYFVAQLEDKDNNQSNWFFVEGPAHIGSENNIGGEVSNSMIDLRIDGLNTRFNQVNIAVIKKIDGQIREPELLFTKHYSSTSVSLTYYSDTQSIKTLSFEEIYNKKKTYIRAQDVFQKDNRLWLYKVRQERNLNYQKRANAIQGRITVNEVSSEYAHIYPTLARGERYQPAIVWVYCDGTYSAAFPINPTGGGGGTSGKTTTTEAFNDNPDEELKAKGRRYGLSSEEINDPSGTGGGSDRGGDCYYPPELFRRRLPAVAGSYTNGGCSITETYSTPEDKKKEPYDTAEEAEVDAFSTVISHYSHAIAIDELAEKAQACICGPMSGTDCPETSGNSCEMQAAICCEGGEGGDGGEATKGTPAKDRTDADLPHLEKSYTINSDWLAGYGEDEETPAIVSNSWMSAAKRLFDKAILKREVILYSRGAWKEDGGSTGGQDGKALKSTGKHRDADGQRTKEGEPTLVAVRSPKIFFSTETYPESKDCNGDYLYGGLAGTPIQLFEMPNEAEEPLVRTFQKGVVSKLTPENSEWGNTFVRILGFEFSNIQYPSADELPKPLSCTNPYRIVYVKRDETNTSVIANGAFFGTYEAGIRGQTHAFNRHGANSYTTVDRHIDINGDHIIKGTGATNKYTFHSPDTSLREPSLIGTYVDHAGSIGGFGFRHGLYTEGKEVPENQTKGTRVDNKGATQSLNLNKFVPSYARVEVGGIMYARADRLVSPVAGISMPLMNKYRESSVYLETEGQFPALSGAHNISGFKDRSFSGDVLDHAAPIKGETWKGSIRRDIPDQYGNVENQTYIDLGLNANSGSGSTISGYCGDTFINMHSIRRTGFVSEKVGNEFNIPALVTHKKKWRTICDSPEDEIFMYTGNNFYCTKLPESGDAADAKNWAGTHTIDASFTRPTTTRAVNKEVSVGGADTQTEPESDYYYPKVVKTLVTFWAESKANTYYRQTGPDMDQRFLGHVYYPKLKNLELDSHAPHASPWEDSWLNRFFARVEQPSKHKIWTKAAIRNLLTVSGPLAALAALPSVEPLTGAVALPLIGGSIVAMWQLMNRVLFNDDYLNRLLGLPVCKTDSEGSDDESEVVQFEDNFFRYSSDYSEVNDLQPYFGMPENYYTCDCDDCFKGETTNEILYSNKQILTSSIDAYVNFQGNQFNTIPASNGKLHKLFHEANTFYAQTSDAILRMNDRLGNNGDLLLDPLPLLEGLPEGFMGTVDPNASINTPVGYYFVNRDANQIVRFYSGGFDVISDAGMMNFFSEELEFCSKGCTDERVSGRYYSLGWDPRYKRILFTKRDGDDSYTMSYDPNRKTWISYHSYNPDFYVWDQSHMYTTVGSDLYIHDDKDCSYQTFYGKYHPHIVEYVVTSDQAFQYAGTHLETEAKECVGCDKLNGRPITYNQAWFFNSDQSTGLIDLEPYVKNKNNKDPDLKDVTGKALIKRQNRQWHLNHMIDRVIDADVPITSQDCCDPYFESNEGNIGKYNNRILSDKYLYNRLIFSNLAYNNIELFTKYTETHVKTDQ
jgi:hypothetical protein